MSSYFGQSMRQVSDKIEGSLMTGLVDGKRGHLRPRISCIDNILMWTGLMGTRLMSTVCDRMHSMRLGNCTGLQWCQFGLKSGEVMDPGKKNCDFSRQIS